MKILPIMFHCACDNQVVCAILSSGDSRDSQLMQLVRQLIVETAPIAVKYQMPWQTHSQVGILMHLDSQSPMRMDTGLNLFLLKLRCTLLNCIHSKHSRSICIFENGKYLTKSNRLFNAYMSSIKVQINGTKLMFYINSTNLCSLCQKQTFYQISI